MDIVLGLIETILECIGHILNVTCKYIFCGYANHKYLIKNNKINKTTNSLSFKVNVSVRLPHTRITHPDSLTDAKNWGVDRYLVSLYLQIDSHPHCTDGYQVSGWLISALEIIGLEKSLRRC